MKKTALLIVCGAVVAIIGGMIAFADDQPAYVGSKKCMKCHFKQHATWKKEKHAVAYETIANEDDKQLCMPCHTTGYRAPGGFTSIDETPDLANVGCESCHGPASKHVELGEEAKKNGGEVPQSVRDSISKATLACTNCHNPHVQDTAAAARGEK